MTHQDAFRHGITRRALAAMAGAALSWPSWLQSASASSVDGRGISDADVRNGFSALCQSKMVFQDGRPFALAQFRGRALLVNFWAHWCVNCVAELKSMGQLQQAAGGAGQLAVVLVSQPKDWNADQGLARASRIPFPLAVLDEPATLAGIGSLATILLGNLANGTVRYGLPVSYMANRSGAVVFATAGGMNWVSSVAMSKAAQALRKS